MKVTILTAVCNMAEFLPRCLDSLLAQTHSDFEAICIDDASSDNTPQVLQAYARRDKRIIVLRQDENTGQATARNHGLSLAQGTFTMMLDADDWLAPDALQQICDALERNPQADCAVLHLVYWYGEGNEKVWECHTDGKKMFTGQEAFRRCMEGKLHGLYAVRTSLHQRFPYDDATRLYSDENTTLLHYLYSRHVVLTQATYYYRRHPQSATHVCNVHRLDRLEADLSLRSQIHRHQPTAITDFERFRWMRVIECYYYFHQHRDSFSREEREDILRRFRHAVAATQPSLLPKRLRRKFGYIPFRRFYLFHLQEEIYFGLRKCLRR